MHALFHNPTVLLLLECAHERGNYHSQGTAGVSHQVVSGPAPVVWWLADVEGCKPLNGHVVDDWVYLDAPSSHGLLADEMPVGLIPLYPGLELFPADVVHLASQEAHGPLDLHPVVDLAVDLRPVVIFDDNLWARRFRAAADHARPAQGSAVEGIDAAGEAKFPFCHIDPCVQTQTLCGHQAVSHSRPCT